MILTPAYSPPPSEPTFYVSTLGNDDWNGVSPVRRGDSGPFATVERALAALREYRTHHANPTEPVNIKIRGGEYELKKPIEIWPQDSGTPDSPTVIEAYKHEHPIISGGVTLKWLSNSAGKGGSSFVARPGFHIEQLYVDGVRRMRPRWPKEGYSIIDRTVASSPAVGSKGYDRFGYSGDDIQPRWLQDGGAEVLAFHLWTMDRIPLANVDPSTKTATLGGFCLPASYSNLAKGTRFIVENVGPPGLHEWKQDARTGELDYESETMPPRRPTAVAPQLPTLMELHGDAAKGKRVENVEVDGLTFAYSAYELPASGHAFPQADIDVPAAIEVTGASRCQFRGITVEHTGGWAIDFHEGCALDLLERSYLEDLGAGGVKIGETQMPADPRNLARGIRVADCRIEHGGRIHPAATGIWIGESSGDTVQGDTIDDFYYTGISIGWVWGYGNSMTRDILVIDNRIENIGQEVLSDMGGIYTLGNETGTVLRGNLIKDVNGFYYGGWGIYFDEGTSNIVAAQNLVEDCKTGCFHQHYGANNLVENNIFYRSRETGLIIRTRAEGHLSLTFEHNIAVNDGVPILASNWGGNGFVFRNNLYWNPHPVPGDFAGKSFAEWRAEGRDKGSLFADPKLEMVDGVLKPAPNSPALKVGFEPFRMRPCGSTLPAWKNTPPAPAFPVFRRKQYPQNIG